MNDAKFLKLIKEPFTGNIHESEDIFELEAWTNGGVDIVIVLRKEDEKTLFEQFKEWVETYDVDEEIDVYRQDEQYKSAFSLRQSLEDFEAFENWLKQVLENLENELDNLDLMKKEKFIYVHSNGEPIGLAHNYEDAHAIVKAILMGDFNLTKEGADEAIAKNQEDYYQIYYDEVFLYEKEKMDS